MERANSPGGGRVTPEFVIRVGSRLRAVRKSHGWTVQQLADTAGVSRRMLTQIELGHANPSLVTVDRLAHALGIDFATLALPEASGPPSARAPSATTVWTDELGSEAVLLAAMAPAKAELWKWSLAPGARYVARPDRAGAQEIHHVVFGTLTIEQGGHSVVVGTGETTVIASDTDYAYRNDEGGATIFLRVVSGT